MFDPIQWINWSGLELPFGTFDLTLYFEAFKPVRPLLVAFLGFNLAMFGWRLLTRLIGFGRGGEDK